MSQELLNVDVFDALQDSMGEDFVEDLVTTFLEEGPVMIADLKTAAEGGNAEALRRAAHSLKSNATLFGAEQLSNVARRLELDGFSSDVDVAAVETAYNQAAAALMDWRDG
jgi:HPt (histidine-containing phosphotransfer) domain-containing protein